MNIAFEQCEKRMKEVASLAQASGLVHWDEDTMMPERGLSARAAQAEALSAVIHEKLVDHSLGDALRALASDPSGLSDDQGVCVREWLRDHEKSAKLPEDLVRELASTCTMSRGAWVKARQNSDFGLFAPWLEKTVELKRRQADCMGYSGVPYDALLDDYEPYMTCRELDPVMENLRAGLVPLAAAIADSGVAIDARVLSRRYPVDGQEKIARAVMLAIGVDPAASRLDRSAHPFCSGIAPTDVRITTRYNERMLTAALYGVIHESGHALYEQGLPEEHMGTPLAEAVSLGVHESQSRLWENVVGRSRPFIAWILPKLKKLFARQLKGFGAEGFYRAVNMVRPSPVRVEADEVTYNLHVVLRYEIEKALLAGEIESNELPAIWNERMVRYLGVRPANDAEGVLQDVHWSAGLFGYFPTYSLGNLYSAQWWRSIRREVRGVDKKIAGGDFGPVLGWLRKKIHCQGRRYPASELCIRATGEPLCAQYFIDYLKAKYGDIYDIRL